MNPERLDKLLRDYKFSNLSLEKTILEILSIFKFSNKSFNNKSTEKIFTNLADILVTYKFDYSYNVRKSTISLIEVWAKDNTLVLASFYEFKLADWEDG